MTGADLVNAARAYLGVPFRHLGRDRTGMDCAGLLIAVARDCGSGSPPPLRYSAGAPDVRLIDRWVAEFADKVDRPAPGDLLRFAIRGRPQHLAISAEHDSAGWTAIHAWQSAGRVCEHRVDDKWRRRLVGCWRLRGVC